MLSTVFFADSVFAHGSMVWPPTWFNDGQSREAALAPFNQCGGKSACDWFTNFTFVETRTMAADSPMRTYAKTDPDFTAWDGSYDAFFVQNGNNPWAAPGSAKIDSPCGVFGGNPSGCSGGIAAGEACDGGGYSSGPDARVAYNAKSASFAGSEYTAFDLQLTDIQKTQVMAGGELDVNYVIQANHGGGYTYRLCRVPDDGDMTKLTEECFQRNILEFSSPYSWIQWGPNRNANSSVKFLATRSAKGTYPSGSVWARQPVPACNDELGGILAETGNNCDVAWETSDYKAGTQFEPVVPGVQGFGIYVDEDTGAVTNDNSFAFTIGDSLRIPKNMPAGDYVLSWRWDCEQTPQVWNTCANLEITAPKGRPAPPRQWQNQNE